MKKLKQLGPSVPRKLRRQPDLETWLARPRRWQQLLTLCGQGPMAVYVMLPQRLILLIADHVADRTDNVHALVMDQGEIRLFVGLSRDKDSGTVAFNPQHDQQHLLATYPFSKSKEETDRGVVFK